MFNRLRPGCQSDNKVSQYENGEHRPVSTVIVPPPPQHQQQNHQKHQKQYQLLSSQSPAPPPTPALKNSYDTSGIMSPLHKKENGCMSSNQTRYPPQCRSVALRGRNTCHNVYSRPVLAQTTCPRITPNSNNGPNRLSELFLLHNIDLSNSIKLGSGRYSEVISARFLPTGFRIAIKTIDNLKITSDFRNKFLPREIDCWKRLNHPNLVRILGHFEALHYVFLAMEYGCGGDMLSYVQEYGPLPEQKACSWLSQILHGVKHMHDLGIAHRDLKLENIIIFTDHLIKISDFGFSKLVARELSSTYCGSKSYTAPEILMGEPYNPYKADVWSIGVIAYVMVTDRMPFNEKLQTEQIIDAQKHRDYVFDNDLNISWPCRLSIDHMLTFSWEYRPDITTCLWLPWMFTLNNSSIS